MRRCRSIKISHRMSQRSTPSGLEWDAGARMIEPRHFRLLKLVHRSLETLGTAWVEWVSLTPNLVKLMEI